MKKTLALLVALVMMLAALCSCELLNKITGKETEAPTESEKKQDDSSSKKEDDTTKKQDDSSSEEDSSNEPGPTGKKNSRDNVINEWDSDTLNVFASLWWGGYSLPWAPVELAVNGMSAEGTTTAPAVINDAVWERNLYIKDTYGVDIDWHAGEGDGMIASALMAAAAGGETVYDLAICRALDLQETVAANLALDLNQSEYVDLSKPWYNQNSIKAFSAAGKNPFVTGGFSYLEEELGKVCFYNEGLAASIANWPDLFDMVREGDWTIDQLITLSKLNSKDNGDGVWDENDSYGIAFNGVSDWYRCFGLSTIGVEEGLYTVTMDGNKFQGVLDTLKDFLALESSLNDGNWAVIQNAFTENRTLFYVEVVQKFGNFNGLEGLEFSAIPMPKLNAEQDAYHSPASDQMVAVLYAVNMPGVDTERAMYFVDVLSQTGYEYVIPAYIENLCQGNLAGQDDVQEMLLDYVFPSISFKPVEDGWSGDPLGSIVSGYLNGDNDSIEGALAEKIDAINEKITAWNLNWAALGE